MLSRAILPAETTQVQQVFSDVPVDAWYAGDVYRAYLTGLICGVGGGRFAPDLTLQNQELVSIAVRAAQLYRTGTVSTDDSALKNWKYQDGIADWAYGNLVYGVNSGLLSRFYENGYFRPTDPATRGEAAVLIYRLWSMMGEEDTQ